MMIDVVVIVITFVGWIVGITRSMDPGVPCFFMVGVGVLCASLP